MGPASATAVTLASLRWVAEFQEDRGPDILYRKLPRKPQSGGRVAEIQRRGDLQFAKSRMCLSRIRQLGPTQRQTDMRTLGNVQELDLHAVFRRRQGKCGGRHKMLCVNWTPGSSFCSKVFRRQA